MVKVTADDGFLARDLGLFLEPVEVRDAADKLLGLFVPANLERGEQVRAEAAARIDWEEIARRKQANEETYPSEEVLERLRLLDAEFERRKAAGERALTEEEGLAYLDELRRQARTAAG